MISEGLKTETLLLFDNGNFRTPVLYSRAVEYQLDEVNKIATIVWQYRNNPDIVSPSRGSAQRLKNGNTLIGWGSTNPTLTEVTPPEILLWKCHSLREYIHTEHLETKLILL